MDETLDELEREGMVACFAWGRRCAAGSFWAYAACAAIRANGTCTRARGREGVWGRHSQGGFAQRRRFRFVAHESAAVEEGRLCAIGLMRTALACTKGQGRGATS